MKATALLLLLVLALPLAAQETVPVDGHAHDVATLEGTWTGGYDCEDTGRSGTLSFDLAPGARSATARLVMVPRPTEADPTPAPIVLALHLVDVDGDRIRGSLAPYDDPEWDLPLDTRFEGVRSGDRLEGTFLSLPTAIDTLPAGGQWWAVREPHPDL